MTLEEAIKHAEEVAEKKFDNAVCIMDKGKSDVALENAEECKRCAEEHRQLAEWLNDYKRLLEQITCEDDITIQAVLEMAYDMSEIDGEHFTEPWMVVDVEDIQKLPSVNPQEPILDKIRAEIEQEYNRLRVTRADETLELGECLGLKMSLKIIGKYKAESEG